MATEVGSAFVSVLPSMKGFGSALGKGVDGESTRAGTRGGRTFGTAFARTSVGPLRAGFGTIGKLGAGIFAGLGAVNVFKGFVSGARESAEVTALTRNAIKTTGGAANLTAKQVGNLATAISNKTGIDDEQIQANENVLLTFTKVRNEVGKGNQVFSRATGLAQDMAKVLKTDASGATLQLGKALNDPIKGITALSRAGVSFTGQQKNQIKALVKSGDTLKAQKIILAEVGKEFGGAAAAAATPMQKLRVTLGNIGEAIGARLLPFIDRGATAIGGFVKGMQTGVGPGGVFAAKMREIGTFLQVNVIPALQSFGTFVTGTVVPALVSMAGFLRANQAVLLPLAAAVVAMVTAFKLYTTAMAIWAAVTKAAAAVQLAFNVVLTANPIGLVVLALVGLAAAVVVAYKRSEAFRNVVQEALGAVSGAFRALASVAGSVASAAVAAFHKVTGAVQTAVGWVRSNWPLLLGILTGPIGAAVVVIVRHWGEIKSGATKAFNGVVDFVQGIPGRIVGALGNLGRLLVNAGAQIIQGLLDGITAGFGKVKSKLGELTGLLPDWKGPRQRDLTLLIPAGIALMDGLTQGIVKGESKVRSALTTLTGNIAERLKGLRDQAAQMRASIADSVRGIVDITQVGAALEDGTVPSVGSIFEGFAAKAGAFAAALRSMVAKKVAPSIIAAVAAAGPAQGLTAANAFASAPDAEIATVNTSVDQIQQFAKQVSNAVVSTTPLPSEIKRQEELLAEVRGLRADMAGAPLARVKLEGRDLFIVVERERKANARR
jgi:hypothetical protein